MQIDIIATAILLSAFFAALADTAMGMGYGTILTPILIIFGYPPHIAVPAVLLSQLVVVIIGSAAHTHVKNFTAKDVENALLMSVPATVLVAMGAFLNVKTPGRITEIYIGALVLFLGFVMMSNIRVKKTRRRMLFVSGLGGLNKGFMGGGLGPILVSGQVVLNHDLRSSVAIADISAIPVCAIGLLSFLALGTLYVSTIFLLVTLPALVAAIIGPHLTAAMARKEKSEKIIGVVAIGLGALALIKVLFCT